MTRQARFQLDRFVAAALGASRADPVPLNQEATAGPWRLTVTGVVTGQPANDQVTAASAFNEAPAEGSTYLLVKVRAKNAGDRPLRIDGDDFALTGASGLVHRFVGAVAPSPALGGTVKPGETAEGWVVLGAATDEKNLLLLYDSLTIPGNWADRIFALQAGAQLPDAAKPAVVPNDVGKNPGQPAGARAPVVTAAWQVETLDVARGQDVYNLFPQSDYRTTALAGADPSGAEVQRWLGLKIKVTDVHPGGDAAFLSPTAFMLADGQGNPIPDVLTLSSPRPDVTGVAYYPGASREGWVLFQLPGSGDGSVIRFQPFATDADPRYLALDGATPAPPPAAAVPAGGFTAGMTVVVTETAVNMRDAPSTEGQIVETIGQGTELAVTGPSRAGSGHTWVPVTDAATGKAGFVAQEFLAAKG